MLQNTRKELLDQLKDATLTAELRRAAEQRVAELESSIKAIKERADQMIGSLTKQR